MSRTNRQRTNKAGKNIAIFGLAAIAMTGAIAGIVALKKINDQIPTTTLSASAYTVGMLSDTDGKVESGADGGLFTAGYYDIENAEVKIKDDANVEVYVNLYKEDKTFLQVIKVTDKTKVSEIASSVSSAKYVRFEIVPEEDADGKISGSEKREYAGQVTITVNK